MKVTTDNVFSFIRQSLEDLKSLTPSDHHTWKSATVVSSGGLTSVRTSTRPDFESILDNLNALEKLSGEKDFAKILVSDLRYQKILKGAGKLGIFGSYSLRPDVIMFATVDEYLWQVESLHFDEDIAEKITDNFVKSLDNGKVSFVDFSVVRGLYSKCL